MVYLLSLLIIFALCILKSHLHAAHYARTSYQIHVKMLYNVLRRSMTWFKFNAYEKIIDDFRSYLEVVDTDLPNTVGTNCQLFSIVLFGILSGMSIMPLLINIMAGILVFWGVSNGRFYRTANEFFFLKSKIMHDLKKNVTQT
jgi:ABC-type multidrug transport system fused ATPase/permease subunit